MDVFIKIIHYLATHMWLPYISAAIIFILQILIPILKADRRRAQHKDPNYKVVKNILALMISMPLIMLAIFKLPDWSNSLVYRYGHSGTGVITRSQETSNMYNEQYVQRYFALIKDDQGKISETQFESWDFNVYPSDNEVSYPHAGEEFAVRYLPSDPSIFVILSNEKSPFTQRTGCLSAFEKVNEAKIKFQMDSLNTAFRKEYIHSIEAVLKMDCYQKEHFKAILIASDKKLLDDLKSSK